MRGIVVFPKTTCSFDVARPKSISALKAAMDNDSLLYVVTQKNFYSEEPTRQDLYDMGCVVRVKQVLKVSDSHRKILLFCRI